MSALPLALPRLRGADVRAARIKAAPRDPLELPDIGRHVAVDVAGAGRYGPEPIAIGVTWGEHGFVVRCAREALKGFPHPSWADLDWAELPPDLAALLLEASLLPVVQAVERATGCDLRIVEVRPEPGPPPPGGLALLLGGGERPWGLHVSPDSPGPDALADLLANWPVAPRPVANLPFPATMRIGTTRLSLAAIRSLRPDDAVLLETARRGGCMLVLADAWLAEVDGDGNGWRLSGPLRPAKSQGEVEWTMQGEDHLAKDADSIEDLDDLPVRLAFDVGRLDIALGELRNLAAGSIIELDRGIDELVRISANGRLVGHGTLVDVEGAVGVRIVRMFDHG